MLETPPAGRLCLPEEAEDLGSAPGSVLGSGGRATQLWLGGIHKENGGETRKRQTEESRWKNEGGRLVQRPCSGRSLAGPCRQDEEEESG